MNAFNKEFLATLTKEQVQLIMKHSGYTAKVVDSLYNSTVYPAFTWGAYALYYITVEDGVEGGVSTARVAIQPTKDGYELDWIQE